MPPKQPYAPVPHSYVPNSAAFTSRINLDEEVKLTETRAERILQESLAEVFSIIITIDELEKAFLKDAIPESDYMEICERNLMQYKALLADETVARAFVGLEEFKAEWGLEVPRATERIRVGMPARTVAPAPPSGQQVTTHGVLIAEATQDFITFLDAMRLGYRAKDYLHPELTQVIQAVNKVTTEEFEGRGKIVQWLITLNQMKATEELTEDQARQMEMDLNTAFEGFKGTLRKVQVEDEA